MDRTEAKTLKTAVARVVAQWAARQELHVPQPTLVEVLYDEINKAVGDAPTDAERERLAAWCEDRIVGSSVEAISNYNAIACLLRAPCPDIAPSAIAYDNRVGGLEAQLEQARREADELAGMLRRLIFEIHFKLSGGDDPGECCTKCGEYGSGMLRDATRIARKLLLDRHDAARKGKA